MKINEKKVLAIIFCLGIILLNNLIKEPMPLINGLIAGFAGGLIGIVFSFKKRKIKTKVEAKKVIEDAEKVIKVIEGIESREQRNRINHGIISIDPQPFIRVAGYYEIPKKYIKNNWLTNEYGIKVFHSANIHDGWIYIEQNDKATIMVTPEAFDDHEAVKIALNIKTKKS